MSYAHHAGLNGRLGYLSGVNDKVEDDEEVTFRFQPRQGVDGPKGERWAQRMAQLLKATGHYEEADYKGWGSGANAGLLVVRIETKYGSYTLQQLANFTKSLADRVSRELNMPVVFLSAVHDNDEAFAQTPAGGGGGGGGDGGGGGGAPATPETSEKGLSSTTVLLGVAVGVGLLALVLSRKG